MKRKKRTDLDEIYPVLSYEDRLIYMKDARISFGFEVYGVEYESMTAAGYAAINSTIQKEIDKLPVGAVVQQIDNYYEQLYNVDTSEKGLYERKLYEYYIGKPMKLHSSYLFFSFPNEKKASSNPFTSFLAKPVVDFGNILKNVEKRSKIAENYAKDIESLINTNFEGTVKLKRLDSDECESLYKQFLNCEFDHVPKNFSSTIHNTGNEIAIGTKKCSIVSLSGQGKEIYNGTVDQFDLIYQYTKSINEGLDFPHVIVRTLKKENKSREVLKVDIEKKLVEASKINKFKNQDEIDNKIKELNEFTESVAGSNDSLVTLSLNILIPAINDEIRESRVRLARNAIEEMYLATAVVETFSTKLAFYGMLPGNGGQITRGLLMPSEHAVCYLNFTGQFRKGKKGYLVSDRFKNPILLDLQNYGIKDDKNGFILGTTGSGKSFWNSMIVFQDYYNGVRQIIIDKDGSYKRVVNALPDTKYFEMDDKGFSTNPFVINRDETGKYILDESKIVFLLALFSKIWKKKITSEQETILGNILKSYYSQLSSLPSMEGFYIYLEKLHEEFIKSGNDAWKIQLSYFDIHSFLLALEKFSKPEGMYYSLFNAKENVSLHEYKISCFDLKGIVDNETLYPIISLLLMELSMDMIRYYETESKSIKVDEAWRMLLGLGTYFEDVYRTIRKKGGWIWLITQGVDELKGDASVGAMLNNSSIKVILKPRDDAEIDKISDFFKMDKRKEGKLRSLRSDKEGREFFVMFRQEYEVFNLSVPKILHALATSDNEERNRYLELLNEYRDYYMAAEIWEKEYTEKI